MFLGGKCINIIKSGGFVCNFNDVQGVFFKVYYLSRVSVKQTGSNNCVLMVLLVVFNKCPEGIFTKISVSGGYFDYLLFCGGVCLFTGIAQIYEFLMCIYIRL